LAATQGSCAVARVPGAFAMAMGIDSAAIGLLISQCEHLNTSIPAGEPPNGTQLLLHVLGCLPKLRAVTWRVRSSPSVATSRSVEDRATLYNPHKRPIPCHPIPSHPTDVFKPTLSVIDTIGAARTTRKACLSHDARRYRYDLFHRHPRLDPQARTTGATPLTYPARHRRHDRSRPHR
jgi:hypothetical protein